MVKVKAPSVNQYGEVLDEYGESALDRKYRNINSAIKRVELPDEPKNYKYILTPHDVGWYKKIYEEEPTTDEYIIVKTGEEWKKLSKQPNFTRHGQRWDGNTYKITGRLNWNYDESDVREYIEKFREIQPKRALIRAINRRKKGFSGTDEGRFLRLPERGFKKEVGRMMGSKDVRDEAYRKWRPKYGEHTITQPRVDRRKPMGGRRKGAFVPPSFSQRTTERTAGGAKVSSTDKEKKFSIWGSPVTPAPPPVPSGFYQRTGFTTTTKVAPKPSSTFYNRGIRDNRTANGTMLRSERSAARDIRHSAKYISATQQAIVDRKIRNTLAENKLAEEIKKVRAGAKEKYDKLQLISETKDKTIEDLNKVNIGQLHSHEVITKAKMNATILGSDAVELNKIIARGGGHMKVLKDMVRKGEISSTAIIGQLDFPEGGNTKKGILLKLMSQGAEWVIGKEYFFKEFDNTGRVYEGRGILQKGGERDKNLELITTDADGDRVLKIVRKRQIILPEEIPLGQPPPKQVSFASAPPIGSVPQMGGEVVVHNGGMVEEWLGGIDLQSEKASSIASSDASFGLGKPNIAQAKLNEYALKLPIEVKEIFNYNLRIEQHKEDEPKAKGNLFGFGGSVNPKEYKEWEDKLERMENKVKTLEAAYDYGEKEANALASELGVEIPYKEVSKRKGSLSIPAKALLQKNPKIEVLEEELGLGGSVIGSEDPALEFGFNPSGEPILGPYGDTGGLMGSVGSYEPPPTELLIGSEEEEEEFLESAESFDFDKQIDAIVSGDSGLLNPTPTLEENFGTLQPEPQLQSEEEEEPIFDVEAEDKDKLSEFYSTMVVKEGDDNRYVKYKWKGYDLLIDTQTDTIIDPLGKIKQYKVNAKSNPERESFINFPSTEEKLVAAEIVKEHNKEKAEEEQTALEEKQYTQTINDFTFDRKKWLGMGDKITELAGTDRVLIYSTQFPSDWGTREGGVRGIFRTLDEFKGDLEASGITEKAKLNLIETFKKARQKKKKPNFTTNNKKLLIHLKLDKVGGEQIQLDEVPAGAFGEEDEGAGAFLSTSYN